MAKAGDSFTIVLKQTHLEWGSYRYTHSRDVIYGEGYIPIPSKFAYEYKIYNSNFEKTGLGYNIFNCKSEDGYFKGQIKAGGCSKKGEIYAKQFHGLKNLKALGDWFGYCDAKVGDIIEVKWISNTDVIIKHFKKL